MAPVLPHLADEIQLHRKDVDSTLSVMQQRWSHSRQFLHERQWADATLLRTTFLDCVAIRKYLHTHTQLSSHDLKERDLILEVQSTDDVTENLDDMRSMLGELLGCASLAVKTVGGQDGVDNWSLSPLPSIKRLVQKPPWLEAETEEEDADGVEELEVLRPYLSGGAEFRFETPMTAKLSCLRCRLFRAESEGALCSRCAQVVSMH